MIKNNNNQISTKQKLYCYVDETGQDTKGKLFIVATMITGKNKSKIEECLLRYELSSQKRITKWSKCKHIQRVKYIEKVIGNKIFKDIIFYKTFSGSKRYLDLTIETIILSLSSYAKRHLIYNFKVKILIDGLKGKEITRVKKQINKSAIAVDKIRGVRDQSEPLIRLADFIAGLIRDAIDNEYWKTILKKAIKDGYIKSIK